MTIKPGDLFSVENFGQTMMAMEVSPRGVEAFVYWASKIPKAVVWSLITLADLRSVQHRPEAMCMCIPIEGDLCHFGTSELHRYSERKAQHRASELATPSIVVSRPAYVGDKLRGVGSASGIVGIMQHRERGDAAAYVVNATNGARWPMHPHVVDEWVHECGVPAEIGWWPCERGGAGPRKVPARAGTVRSASFTRIEDAPADIVGIVDIGNPGVGASVVKVPARAGTDAEPSGDLSMGGDLVSTPMQQPRAGAIMRVNEGLCGWEDPPARKAHHPFDAVYGRPLVVAEPKLEMPLRVCYIGQRIFALEDGTPIARLVEMAEMLFATDPEVITHCMHRGEGPDGYVAAVRVAWRRREPEGCRRMAVERAAALTAVATPYLAVKRDDGFIAIAQCGGPSAERASQPTVGRAMEAERERLAALIVERIEAAAP